MQITEVELVQFHNLFNKQGNQHKAFRVVEAGKGQNSEQLNRANNIYRRRLEAQNVKRFKNARVRHTGTGWNVGTQGTRLKE